MFHSVHVTSVMDVYVYVSKLIRESTLHQLLQIVTNGSS